MTASIPDLALSPPAGDFAAWIQMEDVRRFLFSTTVGDVLLHYSSHVGTTEFTGSTFLSSALLPRQFAKPHYYDALAQWNFNPAYKTWGYGGPFTRKGVPSYKLLQPFAWETPEIFQRLVPLVTFRENPLLPNRPIYCEAATELTHTHGLHWHAGHSAYCDLDELGDVREVLKIQHRESSQVVTLSEEVLHRHLLLGRYALIRFFDVDRWSGRDPPIPRERDHARALHWEAEGTRATWTPVGVEPRHYVRAYFRGFQIILPPSSQKLRRAIIEPRTTRQYCSFLVLDWKHGRIADLSCDPKKLGNYFVESEFPFEISPAFFRREVLSRYQGNPDKFTVDEYSISCHSSWSLRYGINDSGQVFAYLKDLAALPYREQLYWKACNEPPTAGLPKATIKRDFEGAWYEEPEPLRDLRRLLRHFPQPKTGFEVCHLWSPPEQIEDNLIEQIHYPVTNSRKEWEKELNSLDILVTEGLNLRFLRHVADALELKYGNEGSIALLGAILSTKSIAPERVSRIRNPLKELHDLRSLVGAHRKGKKAADILAELREKYSDLSSHYRDLLRRVFEAMRELASLVEEGVFDLTQSA